MLREDVILVDGADNQTGIAEKMAAHRSGSLHRAFSVMIWDGRGRMLLQRRYVGKYHSGGLWTNACCGHPRPGEADADAALRRLGEEMGLRCPLREIGTFTYRAELDADMIEHEFVHVFSGFYEGPVAPHPMECDGYSWSAPDVIRRQIASVPQAFSAWFKKYVEAGWPIQPPDSARE
jgi:isopentenyl-diphosphate Delta-isomerase